MAKQEFDLKTDKRMMNWPSVRAVARAEEIYRSMGGKWRKQKKRDPFAKDAAGNLTESISLDEVINTELLLEKNVPTNKALWSRAKAAARAKFDVYPSAYANAWASKWYKSKGGGWRKTKGKKKK